MRHLYLVLLNKKIVMFYIIFVKTIRFVKKIRKHEIQSIMYIIRSPDPITNSEFRVYESFLRSYCFDEKFMRIAFGQHVL